MAFATLTLSQLGYVLAVRTEDGAFAAPRNRWLNWSLAASVAVTFAVLTIPAAQGLADVVPLDASQVVVAVALAALPFAGLEAAKLAHSRRRLLS
jgi:magnesium-transporting ATPase (P-type)